MGAAAPALPRLDPGAVLIVGEGNAARRCSHALVEQAGGKLRLAGVVSPAELASWYTAGEEGAPGSGGKNGNRRPPRRIVLALDDRRGALPVDELVRLRFQGIDVVDEQQFLQELTHKIPVTTIRPSDLVFSEGFKLNNAKLAAKVCVDWCLGAALLVLALPLIALAGLAIVAESGFPIFYRQERVGRGGRPFRIFKLRTMRQDAELGGPQFASEEDPRITRVGRFLRRARLDELPQLINVFRGEMAIVGPRPERPVFVNQFESLSPYFALRHSVRPGITGWAQVMYGYASGSDEALEKLSYDLYYIKHFSLRQDLEILLRTVSVVLWGKGR
ncbi:MAG: exopolysaccharide biosynthesis polyprenyl glycosylphosphotransferase [Acidobacteria bacterium]|jgi:exopolysaccharide biosynthesis polyprenyl glycosylphosphotransferase|nr:exopolysaccharide biosynthesis polyprenyl glycosylphosphotransferase [Acidobacteriota bacterium]